MEIRVHGRGGQGGVTCAKILAAIHARLGKDVQAFGDYAGERSGAPIRAYARFSDSPITNRNKVYEPDHLLVLDPSLLTDATVAGLKPGGLLLLNTPDPPQAYADRLGAFRVATVDATTIARAHGIGTRSVVIVNTTIVGAYARLCDVPMEAVEATLGELGLGANLPATREAWEAVTSRPADPLPARGETDAPLESPWGKAAEGAVQDLLAHVVGPPPELLTGAWRSQRPEFVTRPAPCSAECPAGNDVVGFVQALAKDDVAGAAAILARTTPLPGVCGRVCPGFCLGACNRIHFDGGVNTRALERWVADHAAPPEERPPALDQPLSFAVIGSGPAGLSAAYQLARRGHRVTLFEREAELGGVLRTGIPAFRLPREVLDAEIDSVLQLGVSARTGETIDKARLAQLAADHDGVIIATGLQKLRSLRIDGGDLAGVEQGIDFLHRVNVADGAVVHGHVVVLGGGNTALDCARTALRLGAERVTVAYRRTRAEMPAIVDEVEEALEEGVHLQLLRAPVAVHGAGRVEAIELAEVELGEPDDSGRRSPVVTDRSARLECDTILLALGQGADTRLLPEGWELHDDGRMFHRGAPLNVFATGDVATWAGTVVHAIGHGHATATTALDALGEEVQRFTPPDKARAVGVSDVRFSHFAHLEPNRELHRDVGARLDSFIEVNEGLEDATESRRCLSCGLCTHCDTCLVYCPEGGIHRTADGGYAIDYDYCKGCGLCVTECPRGGLEMVMP